MNIFEKYKDYVIFTAVKNDLPVIYFLYDEKYIAIYTNCPDKLGFVFVPHFLYEDCEKDKIIGNLVVYFDSNLFEKRYDFSDYNDSDFVLKTHPMYINEVNNSFFELGDYEIHIYHYPHEIINVNNKRNSDFLSFVGVEEDIVRELLYGTKKIISRYNRTKSIFSIHGAALKKDEKGYLFISGSHAGKSTLFVNMLFNGFKPLNDDIVFWKENNDRIILSGCATLPQLRKDTFEKVLPIKILQRHLISKCDLHNEILREYIGGYGEDSALQSIVIPQLGYDKSYIKKVDNMEVLKIVLRACMVHGNYETDEIFLNSLKKLSSFPMFKFCMSNNYDEVCSIFNNWIERSY